jgi:hypothetical protein
MISVLIKQVSEGNSAKSSSEASCNSWGFPRNSRDVMDAYAIHLKVTNSSAKMQKQRALRTAMLEIEYITWGSAVRGRVPRTKCQVEYGWSR